MRLVQVALVVALAAADQAGAAAGQPVARCGAAALPGLEAARRRLPAEGGDASTVVLSALRAASVDEFLRIASAVSGLPPTSPEINQLVRAPAMALPCTAAVMARDRLTYALLLGGYSAREIADIVSGRLAKNDLDTAQRLLMTGQSESAVAAFLDRAMAQRQARAARAPRRTPTRRVAPRIRRGVPGPAVAAADIEAAIQRFARQYDVDPALIHAVMAAESGGAADALSPKGAVGLLQLMPATARMLGVDPGDPIDNLRGGIRYLAGLLVQFGNARDALIAYNAGPTHAERVRRGLAVLYGETRRYLDAIARRYPL